MSEAWKPSSADIEAAMTAALARPNPLDKAHAKALEAEQFINEHINEFDDEEGEEALTELLNDTITELDKNCGHVDEQIIISGLVKVRNLNHKLIEAGEGFTLDAVQEEWRPVDDYLAMSLGYFASRDNRGGRVISIYHGAASPLQRIASDLRYGDVHRSSRLFIPVDGTAQAELLHKPREINFDLLNYYLGEDLMSRIDAAMLEGNDLTDSIRRLGKLNLRDNQAINIEDDVRQTLIDYVNNTLGIQQETPYEISGASRVEFYDEATDTNTVYRPSNRQLPVVGHLTGIGIDTDAGRFRMVASVPFDNNTYQYLVYHLNQNLTLRKMPTYKISTTTKLHVK